MWLVLDIETPKSNYVATPLLEECEDDTHTPEMGTWEFRRTPKTSELDCMGQNTSHWGAFYIIGKLWKCRCRKWARMGHLDICNTSCEQKKGRKSNWQFDSRPLKVENRPDPGVCRGEWDIPLESSQGELQVCFKPRPDWRFEQRVMTLWSPKSPNWDNFEITPWESGDKEPFGCGYGGVTHRILYGGRWWLSPSPGHGELSESVLPMACPNTKSDSKGVGFWCKIE